MNELNELITHLLREAFREEWKVLLFKMLLKCSCIYNFSCFGQKVIELH